MIKHKRLLALVLMLVMAASPALAAQCATACSMAGINTNTAITTGARIKPPAMQMAGMDTACVNEHVLHDKSSQTHDQHPDHNTNNHCSMLGCHFTVTGTLQTAVEYPALQFADTALPKFLPFSISADIPPPIKPPA